MQHTITLKELRPKLPQVMLRVESQMDRFIISKHGHPKAVLMSIEDYESIMETLNETSDPENLKNIKTGLRQVKKGQTVDWEDLKKKHGF